MHEITNFEAKGEGDVWFADINKKRKGFSAFLAIYIS